MSWSESNDGIRARMREMADWASKVESQVSDEMLTRAQRFSRQIASLERAMEVARDLRLKAEAMKTAKSREVAYAALQAIEAAYKTNSVWPWVGLDEEIWDFERPR